jgi:hypothetical protein
MVATVRAGVELVSLTFAIGYGVLWGLETGVAVWVRRSVARFPA